MLCPAELRGPRESTPLYPQGPIGLKPRKRMADRSVPIESRVNLDRTWLTLENDALSHKAATMTQMSPREIRINLLFAGATTTVGALLWILCSIGLWKDVFLPEYALAWRGVGQALVVLGLIWIGLANLKRIWTR